MKPGLRKRLLSAKTPPSSAGSLVRSDELRGAPRRGRIVVTRMRAGLTLLISAAFLTMGTQASAALLRQTATGTTGVTGAQQAVTCPKPKLKGLPKRELFTNATVKFKLTNMTVGAAYVIKAGDSEVLGGSATEATMKHEFLLPDQGTKDRKTTITAIVDAESCENAPWKLEKKIRYHAVTAPATPTTPAAPATPVPPAAVTPSKPTPTPTPTPTPVKPAKLPKPITQRLPDFGPKPGQRAWLTPIDSGSRMDQRIAPPALGRLERKADDASSTTALVGLGIVFALFGISTVGALMIFRRRDEIQFERALGQQLKHLEEGDPAITFAGDDPSTEPISAAEQAPFAPPAADGLPVADAPAEEALPAAALVAGPPAEHPPAEAQTEALPEPAATDEGDTEHRSHVEAELQRVLDDAGLQAELKRILAEARSEGERQGIAIDTDLMLQALVEEIQGSTELSDPARAQLRTKFDQIIAEEAERVPAAALVNEPPAEHPPAEAETEALVNEPPDEHAPAEAQPEAVPEPAATNGANTEHRSHVEAELQRVLDDSGVKAELDGILAEARSEAERQGIAIDTDLMLQALVEEINGSTELSDPARAQLRSKFEQIIADEAQRVPAQ
jgi:hypothetical protein